MLSSSRVAGTLLGILMLLGCDVNNTPTGGSVSPTASHGSSTGGSGGTGGAAGASAGGHALPAVFSSLSFEDAVGKAKQENKLVIVDAMATWCGPCKMMDRQSWPDQKVTNWVNQNGIALQIDVDKQSQWAKTHKIDAMPTIIAFRDGREVKRNVGFLGASDLLKWLDGLPKS